MNPPELERMELPEEQLRKHERRAFFAWGAAGTLGFLGLRSLFLMEDDRNIPWFLRRSNEFLSSFWQSQFNAKALAPSVDASGQEVRVNGDIGLLDAVDPAAYRLGLSDPALKAPLSLSLSELRGLPAISQSFEFKCIEGWSSLVSCKGVRFSELMRAYGVGGESEFAGLTSINGGYFVSWDRKSLLHPQTLLCYEMNGEPLSAENGAPLRVLSPVKYGVKQIKQLGTIAFSSSPPPDYWAQEGYDTYLGL